MVFARRRKDVPFRHLFWLFGLFIIACGFTHFMEYYTFYTPIYRLSGLLKLLTAGVSWGTVIALIPITPRALAMRSPDELMREITARQEAEAALQRAHDELEVRVRDRTAELETANRALYREQRVISSLNERLQNAIEETHHRVKNNLQAVTALLELQLGDSEEHLPVAAVQESLQQIKTIALVHDLLSQDQPIGSVSAAAVLEKLTELLGRSFQKTGPQNWIDLQASPILLPAKAATALALIANELVSNSLKHAGSAPDRQHEATHVQITLDRHDTQVVLTVADNGPGFPRDFAPSLHANLGLELVLTMATHDLHGMVEFGAAPHAEVAADLSGAWVRVIFPEDIAKE